MSYYGIDLGTTTTLVSQGKIGKNGKNIVSTILSIPQKNAEGMLFASRKKLESFFYYSNEGPIVGYEAITRGTIEKVENCLSNVKRKMGKAIVPWLFDKKAYYPKDVSSLYIDYIIKNVIKSNKESKIDQLTVTVPASFTIKQREDTKKAVEIALENNSIKNKSLIDSILISEPVSALIGYLSYQIENGISEMDVAKSPMVLVYDIGGGTLDLTLVQLKTDKDILESIMDVEFKIKELSRFTDIAGCDFDEKIAEYALTEIIKKYPELENLELNEHDKKRIRAKLKNSAKEFKEGANNAFCEDEINYERIFSFELEGNLYEKKLVVDQDDFNGIINDFINNPDYFKNIYKPIDQLLERAKIKKEKIDYVLMVGGMSEMLAVQNRIKLEFGDDKVIVPKGRTEEMVACGAGIYSMMKVQKKRIIEPPSDAYYIKVEGGFEKILGIKDTLKPVEKNFELASASDKLTIVLYAGEDVSENDKIDSKIISTFTPMREHVVDLGHEYPQDTKVTLISKYDDSKTDKIPVFDLKINGEIILSKPIGDTKI